MDNTLMEESPDSKKDSKFKFRPNISKESVYAFLLLAMVNWVSHYLYSMRFGFYEDDYANIPSHFEQNSDQLFIFILSRLKNWVQGHPLTFVPGVITYTAKEISDGIFILYVISFLIVTINSFLMYKILAKILPGSALFAIAGALAFCLFPPDTTKMLLCHSFVLQISLFYLLAASLLYLNGRKIISYFVIVMSLFTYESAFMVFFAVPLLMNKWNKPLKKEMLIHSSVLTLMILLIFLYRSITGEERVMEASSDLFSVLMKIIAGMIIGPVMNLALFYRAPFVTIKYWLTENHQVYWWYYDYIFIIVGLSFAFFVFVFYKMKIYRLLSNKTNAVHLHSDSVNRNDDSFRVLLSKILRLMIVSLIMLTLAYTLSFTHFPPMTIMGRFTSEHLAATFGGSILFACVCLSLFAIAEKFNLRKYAVFILSAYLALLAGYNIYVQKEFVISWGYQKDFWKKVLELAPDLKENTIIIVNCEYRHEDTKYILSNSIYNDMIMLGKLFKFPVSWKIVPKVLIVNEGWEEEFVKIENGELKLHPPYMNKGSFEFQDSNVVFLEYDENGVMKRKFSPIDIQGSKINLKPLTGPTIYDFPKNELHKYLIESE